MVRFSWDINKERANKRKHRVSFTDACYVFADKSLLTIFDQDHSDAEDRWVSLGIIQNGRILVVVHTYEKLGKEESIRIISAREASKKEAETYFAWRR